MKNISTIDFQILARYIREISGIALDESKTYLLETRLSKLISELGCSSHGELYNRAISDTSMSIARRIIDAIITHETLFFRDTLPFELLQHEILPGFVRRKTSGFMTPFPLTIRIWSAGCSTGQEVYSIAIVVRDLLGDLSDYDIKILGTDISETNIARARAGSFNRIEVDRGLSDDHLRKYFTRDGAGWMARDEIRAMTTFKRHNLLDSFYGLGQFDIIFCRNTAIYFSPEVRSSLFGKMADALKLNGYLVVGASESLTDKCALFEPKVFSRSYFYQLK